MVIFGLFSTNEETFCRCLQCNFETRSDHNRRKLLALLFVMVLQLTSPADQNREDAGDGTYGLSSSSEKTGMPTICRCHQKGSTFFSVILKPRVSVRPGLEPSTFNTVLCIPVQYCIHGILVSIVLFAPLSRLGPCTKNEGLWGHRISSPRFQDFRS